MRHDEKSMGIGMLLGGLLVLLGWQISNIVHAQNPSLTPYQITVTAACSGNMNTSSATTANFCWGTDGEWQSINGAVPSKVTVPSPAITINGTTKNLPASFTIGASVSAN